MTKPKDDLTADYLRGLFAYDEVTGVVTRMVRRSANAAAGAVVGSPHVDGYLSVWIDGRNYLLHRLIWIMQTGAPPENDVDHEDGDGSNNRWRNLRDAPHARNIANSKRRSDNTSGFKGVICRGKRFCARIGVDGRYYWLGCFPTAEAAHSAYCAAARAHCGEFARTE